MSSPSSQAIFVRGTTFSGKESVGQRENQEDFSLFRTLGGGSQLLAVMADGMGGHASGEVASKKAVDAFNETFANYPAAQVSSKLAASLQQANAQISLAIKEVPALDGMGCTLIGAHISAEGLHWISVGDSLLYLYRGGKLRRLNADHSMMALINDSVKSGKMSEAEAKNYPYRNALRSAVTGGEIAIVDTPEKPVPLYRGDVLLLATDGILTLTETEIRDLIKSHRHTDAQSLAISIIKAVDSKKRVKQDNTSVQVIAIPDGIAKRRHGFLVGVVAAFLITFACAFAAYFWLVNTTVDITSSVENAFKHTDVPQPKPTAVPLDKEREPVSEIAPGGKSDSVKNKPEERAGPKAQTKSSTPQKGNPVKDSSKPKPQDLSDKEIKPNGVQEPHPQPQKGPGTSDENG